MKQDVTIYTDGGCIGNPGPGGYGVVLRYHEQEKRLSGGFRRTTNNRMEIMAAIVALESLKTPCSVILHSDSKYVVDAMTKGWVKRWRAKGWWRNQDERAKNSDLWQRLLDACEPHQVTFTWVKGHAGHEGNEICDQLAQGAARQENLPVDAGYEKQPESPSKPSSKFSGKITCEGQPCKKCSTPVVRRIPKSKPKPGQKYYYAYYLHCPTCKTNYFTEDGKREQ